MNRNNEIDFTRAMAIIIIVTCHFLMFNGIDGTMPVGRHFGEVGNTIFFAISALLFGLRYETKGTPAFEARPFMKKRIVRLFSSLWPFLILILGIYIFIGVEISPVKAMMNFLGLGWFAKLPHIEHLWFITQIIFCYTFYVIFCKCREGKFYVKGLGRTVWYIVLIVCLILECLLDRFKLPGMVFINTLYSIWIFTHASILLRFIERCQLVVVLPLFVLTNILSIYICYNEDFYGRTIENWCGWLAAVTWLFLLLKVGKKIKVENMMLFLSVTGYELYLVHHALCTGELSVIHISDYWIINYLILWTLTICLGWTLKQIGDRLNKLIMSR